MRRRSASKPTSATRGSRATDVRLASTPSLAAKATRAPSVGSPVIDQPAPGSDRRHERGVVAGGGHPGELEPPGRRPAGSGSMRPSGCVAVAAHAVLAGRGPEPLHEHAVLGQRPVLSEQMTLTEPSVSTAGRRRTSARRCGHAPRAEGQRDGDDGRQALGDGGDGEAHRDEEHLLGDPRRAATPAGEDEGADDERRQRPASGPARRGASGAAWAPRRPVWSSSAIRPMAVAMPVATTMPRARPEVTAVPLKAMLSWSARRVRGDVRQGRVTLATGSDSPVRGASLTRRAGASSRRRSAVTMSPCSRSRRSPGTTSRPARAALAVAHDAGAPGWTSA